MVKKCVEILKLAHCLLKLAIVCWEILVPVPNPGKPVTKLLSDTVFVLPEKVTYRDYICRRRGRPCLLDFLVQSITLSV